MTETLGRGLFATRDLKKGELILAEKAMASGIKNLDEQNQIHFTNTENITKYKLPICELLSNLCAISE